MTSDWLIKNEVRLPSFTTSLYSPSIIKQSSFRNSNLAFTKDETWTFLKWQRNPTNQYKLDFHVTVSLKTSWLPGNSRGQCPIFINLNRPVIQEAQPFLYTDKIIFCKLSARKWVHFKESLQFWSRPPVHTSYTEQLFIVLPTNRELPWTSSGVCSSAKMKLTEQWKNVLRSLCSARLLLHCLQRVSCCSQHCQDSQGSLCLPPGRCRTPRWAQTSRWTRQNPPSTAKGGLCLPLPSSRYKSEHWDTDKLHWVLQKPKPQLFSVWNCFCIRTTLPQAPKPVSTTMQTATGAQHCHISGVSGCSGSTWSSKRSLLQKSWGSKLLWSQGSKSQEMKQIYCSKCWN